MSKYFQAVAYLKYLLHARGILNFHSPFVFNFIKHVLLDERVFYCYTEIEQLRTHLMQSEDTLTINDYGAGSHISSTNIRKIKTIAKHTATAPKFSQLLFRMGIYFEAKKILELGTSLGITTLYLSSVSEHTKVITIEGDAGLASLADEHFNIMHKKNIILLQGSFKELLMPALKQLESVDMVYIDGNHRKEATLEYFNSIINFAHEKSIIIIGDIHWSKGMEEAWTVIKEQEQVTLTLDLFYLGIVFLRKELSKQDFVLRY